MRSAVAVKEKSRKTITLQNSTLLFSHKSFHSILNSAFVVGVIGEEEMLLFIVWSFSFSECRRDVTEFEKRYTWYIWFFFYVRKKEI